MFRFEKAALSRPLPAGYSELRRVRFQDVDAAGIVFYPRIIEYCHDAYVNFLAERGHPLDQVLRDRKWAAPIRHAEADFFKPLRFGDTVNIGIVLAHLEPTEVALAFQLTMNDQVLAIAQSVHTFVELGPFKRIDIPEPVRSILAALPQA
ncbi:MAG: thioesterase family protein [Polyangiaceae bacterium]|nr:thioesterase family protein [Polyangiaceae bacterium]